jgi:hypothetical protein
MWHWFSQAVTPRGGLPRRFASRKDGESFLNDRRLCERERGNPPLGVKGYALEGYFADACNALTAFIVFSMCLSGSRSV